MLSDSDSEKTFVLVKPDGVQRGFIGRIISRFEEKGLKLLNMKMNWVYLHLEDRGVESYPAEDPKLLRI